MQAEAVLKRGGLEVKLIPTPRELSSDCGVALRFDWSCRDEVNAMLYKVHVDMEGTLVGAALKTPRSLGEVCMEREREKVLLKGERD